MTEYEIKFTIFGKKFKGNIKASNKDHAKTILKRKVARAVQIDTIIENIFQNEDATVNHLKSLFNIK